MDPPVNEHSYGNLWKMENLLRRFTHEALCFSLDTRIKLIFFSSWSHCVRRHLKHQALITFRAAGIEIGTKMVVSVAILVVLRGHGCWK